jgi:hypothetical protein
MQHYNVHVLGFADPFELTQDQHDNIRKALLAEANNLASHGPGKPAMLALNADNKSFMFPLGAIVGIENHN